MLWTQNLLIFSSDHRYPSGDSRWWGLMGPLKTTGPCHQGAESANPADSKGVEGGLSELHSGLSSPRRASKSIPVSSLSTVLGLQPPAFALRGFPHKPSFLIPACPLKCYQSLRAYPPTPTDTPEHPSRAPELSRTPISQSFLGSWHPNPLHLAVSTQL